MRFSSCIAAFLIIAASGVRELKAKQTGPDTLHGQVVILKESSIKPAGPVDPGSLIVVDIPDSGSRPPENIKVEGNGAIDIGHVRGVATNEKGESLMGGGYTWYLFKAPSGERSVSIRV